MAVRSAFGVVRPYMHWPATSNRIDQFQIPRRGVSRVLKDEVSTAAHLQLGDIHGQLDVSDGLELLDLEFYLPLWSENINAERLQRRELCTRRLQCNKHSRLLLDTLYNTLLNSRV